MIDAVDSPSSGRFRSAAGVYAGILVAGIGGILAARWSGGSPAVVLVCVLGFALGTGAGTLLVSRIDGLGARIGRNRRRRWALVVPAVAFGGVTLWTTSVPSARMAGLISLSAALSLTIVGWIVAALARTADVDAIVSEEPIASTPLYPPGSLTLDLGLVALGLALVAVNVADGEWWGVVLWAFSAISWVVNVIYVGRLVPAGVGAPREVQVFEAGLVVQRPFTRSLVPWGEVRHVRLQDGELVLDRGLRDVRFNRTTLADPDCLFASIERLSPGMVLPAT